MIGNYVFRYCLDYKSIENYEKAVEDKTQIWEVHHRLETHFSDGSPRWYTNGVVNVRRVECPEGFWLGVTKKI